MKPNEATYRVYAVDKDAIEGEGNAEVKNNM